MRILVTGATGYLGSWVCKELRGRGHSVWAHDSRSVDDWLVDVHTTDCVVHLAWASTARSGVDHVSCFTRTRLLLDYATLANPGCRVVFASSCAVYGLAISPVKEDAPTMPNEEYGFYKRKAEVVVLDRRKDDAVLRLGSLMGRGWDGREKTDVTVNAFAADGCSAGKVTCWGRWAVKPLVHVRDVAEAVCKAVERPDKWSGVTNVCWENWRAGDAALQVAKAYGATVEYCAAPEGRPSASVSVDNSLLKIRLGPGFRFRTLTEATAEFADYTPQPGHKFDPARWR